MRRKIKIKSKRLARKVLFHEIDKLIIPWFQAPLGINQQAHPFQALPCCYVLLDLLAQAQQIILEV